MVSPDTDPQSEIIAREEPITLSVYQPEEIYEGINRHIEQFKGKIKPSLTLAEGNRLGGRIFGRYAIGLYVGNPHTERAFGMYADFISKTDGFNWATSRTMVNDEELAEFMKSINALAEPALVRRKPDVSLIDFDDPKSQASWNLIFAPHKLGFSVDGLGHRPDDFYFDKPWPHEKRNIPLGDPEEFTQRIVRFCYYLQLGLNTFVRLKWLPQKSRDIVLRLS